MMNPLQLSPLHESGQTRELLTLYFGAFTYLLVQGAISPLRGSTSTGRPINKGDTIITSLRHLVATVLHLQDHIMQGSNTL